MSFNNLLSSWLETDKNEPIKPDLPVENKSKIVDKLVDKLVDGPKPTDGPKLVENKSTKPIEKVETVSALASSGSGSGGSTHKTGIDSNPAYSSRASKESIEQLNQLSKSIDKQKGKEISQPGNVRPPQGQPGAQQPLQQPLQQQQKAANNPQFEFDRYFLSWLKEQNTGFVISSYKTHKVFSLGHFVHQTNEGLQSKLSLWISHFNRPMGIHCTKDTIWVSSSGNMWRFENSGEWTSNVEEQGKFDANYVPRLAYFSNDIDTHDICVDKNGLPYYCSAMFSCICVPSTSHSFKVYWKPPWIDKISPEDRCHLNGICSRDGVPRYITAVCKGNVKGAWREQRVGHGVAYDIVENKSVCEGLTMPHSPRWFRDKLWILEAGTGYFGYVENGEFVRKVFLPGYLRGLCFVNDRYAVVGSSQDRHEQSFQGLPLGDSLKKEGISAKCGMYIIDLHRDFSIVHSLTFQSPVDELYDICAIKGVTRPKLSDIGDEANMREFLIDKGDTLSP